MRALQKTLLAGAIFIITTSCISKYHIRHLENEVDKEKISFVENNYGAKVKWKKKIGTLSGRTGYLVGVGPTVLPDGNVFFQNQNSILGLDSTTGEVRIRYEKPEGYVAALDHAFISSGKRAFPLVSNYSAREGLLIIDDKKNERKTIEYGWCTEFIEPIDGTIIDSPCTSVSTRFIVRELDTGNKIWEHKVPFSRFLSIAGQTHDVIILYQKKSLFYVEAYDLVSGKFLWENQFEKQKANDWLTELWGLKELFVTEFYVEAKDFNGKIVSLNPRSGEINWQMADAVRIYTKRYGEDDNFYYYKRNNPELIYVVDQTSGTERLKLSLKGHHSIHGIIATPDKIFYPGIEGVIDYPVVQYNTFSAVNKKTGESLWTLKVETQAALPQYKEGTLYFGNRDEFERYYSGTLKGYQLIFDLSQKEYIPRILSKTAFAVDAESGKILWKVKLEGADDDSYIEKILVNDNMVFIKSLSGWLYALEWEKSKP